MVRDTDIEMREREAVPLLGVQIASVLHSTPVLITCNDMQPAILYYPHRLHR